MSEQLNFIVSAIESATGKHAQRSGDGYRLCCSGHGGKDKNLSVSDGENRILLHCHSHGCDPKDILEGAGLSIKDIYYEQFTPEQQVAHKKIVTEKTILNELRIEITVLALWIGDKLSSSYPKDGNDPERIKLAFNRIKKGLNYLESFL